MNVNNDEVKQLTEALNRTLDIIIWLTGGIDLTVGQPGHEYWTNVVLPELSHFLELNKSLQERKEVEEKTKFWTKEEMRAYETRMRKATEPELIRNRKARTNSWLRAKNRIIS